VGENIVAKIVIMKQEVVKKWSECVKIVGAHFMYTNQSWIEEMDIFVV